MFFYMLYEVVYLISFLYQNQYYGQAGYANQSAVTVGDSQFYQQNASYDYSTYYSQQQAANASQSMLEICG